MTLLEKINSLTWYDLINKLKDILKGLNDKPVVDSRPYKVYTALLTQSGTNAPVATVLENTLGEEPVWSYTNPGNYSLSYVNLFPVEKTLVFFKGTISGVNEFSQFDVGYNDNDTVRIYTTLYPDGYGIDGVLYNASIEIRVYN